MKRRDELGVPMTRFGVIGWAVVDQLFVLVNGMIVLRQVLKIGLQKT